MKNDQINEPASLEPPEPDLSQVSKEDLQAMLTEKAENDPLPLPSAENPDREPIYTTEAVALSLDDDSAVDSLELDDSLDSNNDLENITALSTYRGYSKKELFIIYAFCTLAIIIGLSTYFYLAHKNISNISSAGRSNIGAVLIDKTAKVDPVPTSYANQTLVDHDYSVSLSFDPNATTRVAYLPAGKTNSINLPSSENIYLSGDELNSPSVLEINIQKWNLNSELTGLSQSHCAASSTAQGSVLAFETEVMGSPTAFCRYSTSDTESEAFIKTGGDLYMVQFGTTAGLSSSYTQSMQVVATSLKISPKSN